MKRRSFIQGALLSIPLIACKKLPAIAEEGLEPWQSRSVPGAAACQRVSPWLTGFEKFRALAQTRVEVVPLSHRGINYLRICLFEGNPVNPTEYYDYTFENYFDEGDDIEKVKVGFIASAYQYYKNANI